MRERLIEYIKRNGIMRKFVAQELQVSKQHLTNYLNGNVRVSREMEEKVARYLQDKGVL